MRTALFVDFDNVYSGLRRMDQRVADRFARDVVVWMQWIVEGLALPEGVSEGQRRRILVRRCYLNPQAYQRFRPFFNVAGFEIVDCPSLTGEGKTSTDIHMVLDIVDLLQHETRYDEFIVFSADADFTPVLRKLRRWDRRTTVLAIGFPSAAYRASADLLIDQDDFVQAALGIGAKPLPTEPRSVVEVPVEQTAEDPLLAATVVVREVVGESAIPVHCARLASVILSRVSGLEADTWANRGTFRQFVEALELGPLKVSWTSPACVYDPKRHALGPAPAASRESTELSTKELAGLVKLVQREVSEAEQAVPLSKIAAVLSNKYPSLLEDGWDGKGTFRKFIESLDLSPVQVDWSAQGGKAYVTEKKDAEADVALTECKQEWEKYAELLPIATQIHEATSVPLLPPSYYRALFRALVADLAEHPYDMETSRRVRDRSRADGYPLGRADVMFVLRGLSFRGHGFGKGNDNLETLSSKFNDNVRFLCLREQIVIDHKMDAGIHDWIGGKANSI